MKTINALESLTLGLLDGGGKVFTNFPGYMSHQLFSSLGGKTTSVNEKIAYEIAWGSSFAGKRSVVTFKNVGLNDAADPFLNSMIVGVNAGLIVVVFDDVFVEGSQSRQDSRHYFDFFNGLWFEPYSIQNAYDIAYRSFALSEKFQVPVVIRMTSQLLYLSGKCSRRKIQEKILQPVYDHKRFVIHPTNSKFQRQVLAKKNARIQNYVNNLYKRILGKLQFERKDKIHLLVFGCCLSEQKKYLKEDVAKIQLFTYPIPKIINQLVRNSNGIRILEQGSTFAYEKILSLTVDNLQIKINSGSIPDKSDEYIVSKNYEKLFSAIKEVEPSIVVGDLGEYTKETMDTIDVCLCFGSSISVGIGCITAGFKNVFSITGDAAYLHSGKNSIPEAIERNAPIKVIVLCNGGSRGTGGQKIPGDLYYQPHNVQTLKLNYKDSVIEMINVLREMMKYKGVSVLYLII